MATLTIKNIPDELYKELKQRASDNRRSINSEVIYRLERSFTYKPSPEEIMEDIRLLRESLTNVYVTEEDLQRAKNEGRP